MAIELTIKASDAGELWQTVRELASVGTGGDEAKKAAGPSAPAERSVTDMLFDKDASATATSATRRGGPKTGKRETEKVEAAVPPPPPDAPETPSTAPKVTPAPEVDADDTPVTLEMVRNAMRPYASAGKLKAVQDLLASNFDGATSAGMLKPEQYGAAYKILMANAPGAAA